MKRALAILVWMVPSVVGAQATQYTVRRGDTCGQTAREHYGHSRRYDLIHEANPDLGAMPHHLAPGRVLRLPPAPPTSNGTTTRKTRRTPTAATPEPS